MNLAFLSFIARSKYYLSLVFLVVALVSLVLFLRRLKEKSTPASASQSVVLPDEERDPSTAGPGGPPGTASYSYTPSASSATPIFTFSGGPITPAQADNPRVAAAINASNAARGVARTATDIARAKAIASPEALAGLGQRSGITATADPNSRPSNTAPANPTAPGPDPGQSASASVTIYLSPGATEELTVRDSTDQYIADGRLPKSRVSLRITSSTELPKPNTTDQWPAIYYNNRSGNHTLYGLSALFDLPNTIFSK